MIEPMSPPPSRRELIEQTHWARSLAFALVRDPSTADDIAQDALTLSLQYPRPDDPKSWLAGVVRNLVAQRRRREARRRRREREAARPEGEEDKAATLERAEAQQRLVAHVLSLGERHRDVLLSRYFEGETPRLIAAREGRSVASVSNQLTRAHAVLRQRLEADGAQGAWLGAILPLLRGDAGLMSSVRPVLAAEKAALPASAPMGAAPSAWAGKAVLAAIPLGIVWVGIETLGASPVTPSVSLSHGVAGELATRVSSTAKKALPAVRSQGPSRMAPGGDAEALASLPASPEMTSLSARLLDTVGSPVPNATLELQGKGCQSVEVVTDEQGYAFWQEAPISTAMTVAIELDGLRWPEPIAQLELERGQEAAVVWTIHPRSVVQGIAIDEFGAPLPGQLIQLIEDERDGFRLATEYRPELWCSGVVTDGAGRFVFPPQRPGAFALFPSSRGTAWSDHVLQPDGSVSSTPRNEPFESQAEVAPCPWDFRIPHNVAIVDVTATFHTRGRIRGQAVSAGKNDPIPGAAKIAIKSALGSTRLWVSTEDDGSFTSPPLPPGRFEVRGVRGAAGWCSGPPAVVESGASDVNISFAEAAAVSVRVEFALGVTPVDGSLMMLPPGGQSDEFTFRYHRIDADRPEVEEQTLPPGQYGFAFQAKDRSCVGILPFVELGAGPFPGGLVIPVVPVAEVQVINEDSTSAHVHYFAHGVRFDSIRLEPGDTGSLLGPPGEVTIRRTLAHEERPTERPTEWTVQADSGKSVRVAVR